MKIKVRSMSQRGSKVSSTVSASALPTNPLGIEDLTQQRLVQDAYFRGRAKQYIIRNR